MTLTEGEVGCENSGRYHALRFELDEYSCLNIVYVI